MGGTSDKSKSKNGDKPKAPPAKKPQDDEVDDGDIATPKRGIEGDDDQPL